MAARRTRVAAPVPVRRASPFGGWRTAKRPELQKVKGGQQEKEASDLSNSAGSDESCGGGQPNNGSYRRGREERRRKQHLNCQILLAPLSCVTDTARPDPLSRKRHRAASEGAKASQ
ncbi:uncharacterized protein VSU04_014794 isoform 1-T1 [Chlamydotis macqueenii]